MKLVDQTSRLTIEDTMNESEAPAVKGVEEDINGLSTAASKPKRVRTGCLTCRERHLKCDEGLPNCQNCKKSNRECKRGMRLNFIDTKVEDTQVLPPTSDWKINFQDESRDIASEYKGGAGRYTALEVEPEDHMDVKPDNFAHTSSVLNAPVMSHQPLPPMNTPSESHINYSPPKAQERNERMHHSHSSTGSTSSHTMYTPSESSYVSEDTLVNNEPRNYLSTPDEVLFMQVFIEEVAIWMDSMDKHKHFSRILPFFALDEPMLCNALLACGARHLSLVNPAFSEDRALHYYDSATRALLKSLQNPNRDTVICATAAVVLNVYEVMSEKALQRMNHIAGARALVKECGWSARAHGIGLACFWLNVGMELLSCLHFNWQIAWNPDDWGVDMTMEQDRGAGNEEVWTYKIVYITAKIANFRASIPRFQDPNPTVQAMRTQQRLDEWNSYKKMCDDWNHCVPPTMRPLAQLLPHQTATKSQFPEIWYVKRTSITARLFYHTAMVLLPQMHPTMPLHTPDMYNLQMHHAKQICGIVAHVKDRGVASVAIRTLTIAAECLSDFEEQSEILTILPKIKKETGWRIDFITGELKQKWGWSAEYVAQQQERLKKEQSFGGMMQSPPADYTHSQPPPPQPRMNSPPVPTQPPLTNNLPTTLPPPPQISTPAPHPPLQPQQPPPTSLVSSAPPISSAPAHNRIPSGIVNPLMRTADFTAPQHPYQNVYVPPIHPHNESHYIYRMVDGHWH